MNPLTILMYLPACLSAAKAVEDTFASEPGATKLKLITDSVQAAVTAGGGALDPKILKIIQVVISAFVGVANSLGLFGTKTPATPAA